MSDDDRTTSTLSRKVDQLAGLVGGDRARAERTYRMMAMAVGRNAQLANVAPERLFLAVQQILVLNLNVGPMGAYPVPFKGDVTVIVSGQGLVELMMRSGLVRDVAARVVYEHDQFDLRVRLKQRPAQALPHGRQGSPALARGATPRPTLFHYLPGRFSSVLPWPYFSVR